MLFCCQHFTQHQEPCHHLVSLELRHSDLFTVSMKENMTKNLKIWGMIDIDKKVLKGI